MAEPSSLSFPVPGTFRSRTWHYTHPKAAAFFLLTLAAILINPVSTSAQSTPPQQYVYASVPVYHCDLRDRGIFEERRHRSLDRRPRGALQ